MWSPPSRGKIISVVGICRGRWLSCLVIIINFVGPVVDEEQNAKLSLFHDTGNQWVFCVHIVFTIRRWFTGSTKKPSFIFFMAKTTNAKRLKISAISLNVIRKLREVRIISRPYFQDIISGNQCISLFLQFWKRLNALTDIACYILENNTAKHTTLIFFLITLNYILIDEIFSPVALMQTIFWCTL